MVHNLSNSEIRFFRDTGYLRLRSLISVSYLERMKAVILDHIKRGVPPVRMNDDGRICRLDCLMERNPVFLEVLRLPYIVGPLKSLLGPNIEIPNFRHNHATLNHKDDVPFRLHRDITQWSRSIVTAFIYLEESTVDNGCTHIVPGTQHLPFAGPQADGGGGNWADAHTEYNFVMKQAVPVPMPKGGVLLMDSLVFHSVGTNSTARSRMSATFAFHSVDDLVPPEENSKRVLLVGERIYMGSDSKAVSGPLKRAKDERTSERGE